MNANHLREKVQDYELKGKHLSVHLGRERPFLTCLKSGHRPAHRDTHNNANNERN